MLAIDLPVNILLQSLASRGRPHMYAKDFCRSVAG
jgi:hypothetical protein